MADIDVGRSGRWLLAASYDGNKITVNSIDKDGLVGAVQQLIPTKPNAHAIHADAANRFVFASSLGGDNLSAWRFDAGTGALSANEPALVASPRKSAPPFRLGRRAAPRTSRPTAAISTPPSGPRARSPSTRLTLRAAS